MLGFQVRAASRIPLQTTPVSRVHQMTGRRLFWVNKLYLHTDGRNMNLLLGQPQCLRLLLPIRHAATLPSRRMTLPPLLKSLVSRLQDFFCQTLPEPNTATSCAPSQTLPLSLATFLPLSSHPLSWPLFQILPVVKNIGLILPPV